MSEGFLGKLGGSDVSKMMLFMFLGLIVAILVLGFHRSPQAQPMANVGSPGTPMPNANLTYGVSAVSQFTESRIP